MSSTEHTSIVPFAKANYLAYAMKVVKDRAIPDVEDGLKPVQRRILYAMQQLKLLPSNAKPMKCARVVGDCFVAGTLVHAEHGLRPIEAIEPGEFVRMPNGQLSRVVQAFENPASENVRVCLANGTQLETTAGQLFRVLDDELNIQWIRADELAGKTVLVSSPKVFGFAPTHADEVLARRAYAMGLLVAEGYLTDRGRGTRVGIRMVDREPLEKLEQACYDAGVQSTWSQAKAQQPHHHDQWEMQILGFAEAFEVCENTDAFKRVPQWVLEDRRLYAPFLAGLLDGNGAIHMGSKEAAIVFRSTSTWLTQQINAVLMDCGVHSSTDVVEATGVYGQAEISLSGANAYRVAEAVLPYAASLQQLHQLKECLQALSIPGERGIVSDYLPLAVNRIESAGAAKTYDVQIEHESHEFLVHGCAVHNCIGKYHPHGDSAVYEAMVRMSQPFSLRYPLVHGEGNFGSRDGDSPAAMRYTEARLAPIAAALLDELAWDTVDFKPTYDNTQEEPVTLPSRLPFLLLNGSYGIAVGMATNCLSHNLVETVEAAKLLISKPKASFDEVMDLLQGPDFPTGGQLISSREEIKTAYKEGRGTLRLRSKWVVEPMGKSWRLVVNELPQDTSTAKVMMQIDELLDPKPVEKNGKKQPLKPEQLRLKKMFGDMIDSYVDGSDKDHPVRLVIEPKDRKLDGNVLAMALCAHTEMEMNISPNFVSVDLTGTPRQGGIVEWLRQWCDYRVETVRRRLTDEKSRVDRRLHLLAGRLSILDRIEEVIRVLKKSQEPKKDLMEIFGLDEIQAEDVLEMRLRQLANLEKTKLLDEQAKLLIEQDRLAKLLGDEKLMRKLIIKELDADAKQFGDARRTELAPAEATNAKKQSETLVSERLSPEPVGIVLTERGWLGWRPAKTVEEAMAGDYKIKAGDQVKRVWFGDRNSDYAVFMDETGRAYSLKLTDLPSKADMLPLTTWFDSQARISEGALGGPNSQWIVMGTGGYGFVVKGADWINRMKAGKAFLTLGENERPLPPIALPEGLDPKTPVVVLSTDGRAVVFGLDEIKQLPKGKGVGFIGLAPDQTVSDAALVVDGLALRTAKGVKANMPTDLTPFVGARSTGKKGKPLHKQSAGAVFIRPGREGMEG